MLKNILNKKAEGYIDVCVGVVVFVMVLVIAINIFSFITLKVEMDQIAEELIEASTYYGGFDTRFDTCCEDMQDDYFDFDVSYGADSYFNATYERVQLGERMWVTVSKQTYVKGLGIFKIPITVSVTRSGLSEKYWK
jgi:hypothetical protein